MTHQRLPQAFVATRSLLPPSRSAAALPPIPDRDDEEFEDGDEWQTAVDEAERDREKVSADGVRALFDYLSDDFCRPGLMLLSPGQKSIPEPRTTSLPN